MSIPDASASQSRPRQRWFRYSLRTMLLFTTAVSVWLGLVLLKSGRQERAVKTIEGVGGTVAYDWQFDAALGYYSDNRAPTGPKWLRSLIGPHFFDTVIDVRLSKNGLENTHQKFADIAPSVANFPRLRHLSLSGVQMDDHDFAMVTKYVSTDELICGMMEISDAAAAELANSTPLRKLGLNGVKISTNGIAELKRLPNLESFWLSCHCENDPEGNALPVQPYFTGDDAVPALLAFPRLRHLGLMSSLVSDEGIAKLCALTDLESLDIYSFGPRLTNDAVEHIVKLKRLTWLAIGSEGIDDQCLARLQELPRLRGLVLYARVTNEGLPIVAQLQQLEKLILIAKDVDDRGLLNLASMRNLKLLDLQRTAVTPDGAAVKQLQQALPNCDIITYHPPMQRH